MPAKPSPDPLVPLPMRVPQSVRLEFEREAEVLGRTLSDVVRQRLDGAAGPPLGALPPRRRNAVTLAPPSAVDPDLIRQLAAIGSNLNQLAKAANTGAIASAPLDAVEVLSRLRAIELAVERIAASTGG